MTNKFLETPGFHISLKIQVLIPSLKHRVSCLYSCYVCLELLCKRQPQHCHFCPPPQHAKTFWHPLGTCCVLGMVLKQHCLCFLEALADHPLPPLLVQNPLFVFSHSRFVGDAWMAGDHRLLCLETSSNQIMKVGKDPLVRGLSFSPGWEEQTGSEMEGLKVRVLSQQRAASLPGRGESCRASRCGN